MKKKAFYRNRSSASWTQLNVIEGFLQLHVRLVTWQMPFLQIDLQLRYKTNKAKMLRKKLSQRPVAFSSTVL